MLGPFAALALDGRIVDAEGRPVPGARVCYMLGLEEQVCGAADDEGRIEMPASDLEFVRVVRAGYLPASMAAADWTGSVVLRRAAIALVLLQDGDGAPIAEGEVTLIYPSGHRVGPLPARPTGVRIRSLEPGPVRVAARAEGYRQAEAEPALLEAGSETRVVARLVKLRPAAQPE